MVDYYQFYSQFFSKLGNPNEHGDVQVVCPSEIHKPRMGRDQDDPGFSINTDTGLWKCFSCGAAGDIYQFYQEIYKVGFNEAKLAIDGQTKPPIPWGKIEQYKTILQNAPGKMKFLQEKRGLTQETIKKYHMGYDAERFCIPILDHTGSVVNVRRYDPGAKGPDKVKNVSGHGMLRLFPWANISHPRIHLVGGELDAILTNQMGLNSMTSTNGELSWSASWDRLFVNKEVVICYDNDETGRSGATKVAHRLVKTAKWVKVINLSVGSGEDITDYFVNHGYSAQDFNTLVDQTQEFKPESVETNVEDQAVYTMHLSQASKGEYYNKKVRFHAIVAGKDLAPYIFPQEAKLLCNVDAGDKCALCTLGLAGGSITVTFKENDPGILHMIGVPDHIQSGFIKHRAGVHQKCRAIKTEVQKSNNVEEVILIPELDFSAQEQEYVSRRCYYVGHGLTTNRAYEMYAVTVPHPFTQSATHLIYDVKPSQDDISTFKMSPEMLQKLKDTFQTDNIANKLDEIYEDFTYNITKIYGREDLLTAIDLVFHSCLSFYFQDKFVNRGWMECLIVGDPRSGKTESAQAIMRHYRLGEFVTGENASYAGLIGGMQQNGKKWTVTWGKVPLNDRRLVVIDEVSGLPEWVIGNMSGVRSSGVAEITKIQTERTNARTRLIWMSNPRAARTLNTYSYGVQAIRELIGRPEDIARFDFAITSASDEVPAEVINAMTHKTVYHRYTSQLCKTLVLWAWSRKPEQIHFDIRAVEAILKYAIQMGKDYSSQIPLVEVADQRIKLARLSMAVACRVFSTEDGTNLQVRREHVEYAYEFLGRCYRKSSLAYFEYSQLDCKDEKVVLENKDEITRFITDNRSSIDVFMRYNSVKPREMEDMLGIDKDQVRYIINFLVKYQLVVKTKFGLIKRPHFIKLMKEFLGYVHPGEKEEEY